MPRSTCWYKAMIISLLLHCLLLAWGGWIAMSLTAAPKEEQYTEMELGSDVAEMDIAPNVPTEPTESEAPAENIKKEESAQEPQQQTDKNQSDIRPAPLPVKVSDQDVPEQTLSRYTTEQLNLALAQYNRALATNPKSALAFINRGQVYYDKGELDKALADFSKSFTINPDLTLAHVGRGFVFIKKDQWDLALEEFNQAIRIAPQDAFAYYGRALCFSKSGDKQKAANDFRFFIQYAKPESNSLIQRAHQMLSRLGESEV